MAFAVSAKHRHASLPTLVTYEPSRKATTPAPDLPRRPPSEGGEVQPSTLRRPHARLRSMARGMKKDGGGGTWILMKKYEVGKLVGKGTFAKVYHARRLGAGESVAIKVIDKERVMRVGMIDQIKREISILHRVRHPNIVRLHEVMASKTKIYFVMEYVRGGELFGKVAKGRIKEDAARKYFRQLLGAVDFCHSKGVYHRDLKPENLLVDDDGQLKVSDFGLSAIMESRQQDGLLHTTCGTPAYIAPEVINNKGYDGAKADLWSLGVVLFVLTTGYLPFDDSSLPEMYRKIRKGEFKCPHWLSTDLKKLLHRLLDPNPGSRISMGDIMECPWFKTGLSQRAADARQIHNLEQNPTTADTASATFHLQLNGAGISADRLASVMSRPCLNAFDIISLSPAFNLSGLFMELDGGRKPEARFMTRKLVPAIVSKPGEIGAESREMGFQVRKKDGAVKLEGSKQGRKGTLAIDTEIFQVTPSFFVVEVTKAAGDTIEYQRFCSRELGPILFW